MFDIKKIRDNPKDFDKNLAKRGLNPNSELLIIFSISSPVNVSYVISALAILCKSSIFSVNIFFAWL